MKHVNQIEDLPPADSFCAVKSTTIYTPGDERSRTCPGHGYPESWDPAIELISFSTMDDLSAWATKNHADLRKYKFFKMTPLTVEPTVHVKIANAPLR